MCSNAIMATNQELGTQAGTNVICKTLLAFEKAGFTVRKIAKELALIAYSDIQDYVKINEGGLIEAFPLDTLKPGRSRAIKKVKEKRRILNTPGDKEDTILDATYEFELYDKLEALRMAVDIIGIKKPAKLDVKHSGAIDFTNKTDEELDETIKTLTEQAGS